MNRPDPVDDMLRRAFDADAARHTVPDVSLPVMRQVRRQLRMRITVLGGAVVAGLAGTLLYGFDISALTMPLWGGDLVFATQWHVDAAVLLGAVLAALGLVIEVFEQHA